MSFSKIALLSHKYSTTVGEGGQGSTTSRAREKAPPLTGRGRKGGAFETSDHLIDVATLWALPPAL